jgi:NAD+ synthetase
MKVTMAQVNPTVGDLEGNVKRCLAAIQIALPQNPDLILFPELAIPGCHPRDILFDPSFITATITATQDLAYKTRSGPPVLVGTILPADKELPNHPGLLNAGALLQKGKIELVAAKRILPTHDVFYEPRWFLPGPTLPPITIKGRQLGVLLGHDLTSKGDGTSPPFQLIDAGAEILVCLAASPYKQKILDQRLSNASAWDCPVLYLNLCGANDELIYDGRSFALNAKGQPIALLVGFQEDNRTIDLESETAATIQEVPSQEELFQALHLGVKDFMEKNQLDRTFLGLSGGVDSAVVAVILAEAFGPEHVTALSIPSRFTDPDSVAYAKILSEKLGIEFETVDLEPLHIAVEEILGELLESGTGGENVQPRLRSMILMSYVNRHGGVLINTSNKTELSLGYATLYGDMAGSLCPIADLTKPEVYALAKWINREEEIIPSYIIERQPTAELKPGQVDPFDYDKLAPEMEVLIGLNRSNFALRSSEHKRWQMGVVLKVNEKSFGIGRMIPITRK